MDRFMDKIGDAIAPIAQKMTANRYLSAIKEGFFGSTPILIAGSIFLLFTSLPFNGYTEAKSLANYYKVDSKLAIALSFVGILLLTPVIVTVENVKGLPLDNFSAQGLFVCMIAAALAVEIYRWCVQKGFTIKMPDSVPQNVSSAFAATILVLLVEAVIWCFGLHGSSIVSSVMNPIWFAQSAENLAAFEAGLAMPHIVNYQFISFFVKLGGVGATLSLTLLCLFKAKSDQYRALGKLGIGASLFNINEPIIFGFPIVLNPMMMIPFILANISVGIVTYLAIYLGLVPMINGINLPYTIPAVISGFMISGWQGALLQVVLLLLTGLIYYPFFKAQDKQAFIEEQAKKEALLD